MKYVFLIVLSLIVVGCEKSTYLTTDEYILPEELSHCKVYKMKSSSNTLHVVHCPNSATSTYHSCGKNCTANNTIISK